MTPRGRAQLSGDQLATAAGRLTDRDRRICELVWEHRVLTTHHIAQLAFDSLKAAEHRLLTLARLAALDRFRPLPACGQGSRPFHYVLGPLGAYVVAGRRGLDVSALRYRRDHALAVAYHQRLAHILGVNGFFAALSAAARRSEGAAELLRWWPERRCAAVWGDYVRPDGYGRWRQGHAGIDFFLEYDRGTERPANRLTDRLADYAELAEATGISTPVLLLLPNAGRETAVRARLSRPPVPTATSYPMPGSAPSDAVWLPAGCDRVPRRPLIALR